MGNENSSRLRAAFEKLDKSHSGALTLDEMLTIQKVPGLNHPIHNSPLLLYRVCSFLLFGWR
jgi:Ca2+-binding EF-hand superfamily protein